MERVYINNHEGYTYTVFNQSSLTLTEKVSNAPKLKWQWVYDVLGYYVLGTANSDESVTVEEKTKSGFFLPSSAQEKPQTCQVVAVGPGGIVDGKEIKMQVKVGDKVLCAKYSGAEFKVDGKELTIIRQSDILAIVE